MPDRSSRTSLAQRRRLVLPTAVALLTTLLTVFPAASPAGAAEAPVFDIAFTSSTVDGPGTVTKPTSPSGTNQACLTAAGNSSTPPLLSCPDASDAEGSGALRLTPAAGNAVGGVFASTGFPTNRGLEVSFNSYQYGGSSADGIGFILAAVDPSNSVPPAAMGPAGGSLGYSAQGSANGVDHAYLGVGLDVYGNYSDKYYEGTGCTNPNNISAPVPGAIVVRGPGSGTVGYCALSTSYDGTAASQLTLRAGSRSASVVPVRVLVNATSSAFTSSTGVSVDAGTYQVIATPVGGSAITLSGALPAAPSSLYPATSWTSSSGVPKQLAIGFSGSTGGANDVHEISDVQVRTAAPVPQLTAETTSYSVAAPAPGDPVSYLLNPSVQPGEDVDAPVSVTLTTPSGVLPLAAYGGGWVCAKPVGQTLTCTNSGSSFPAGTHLPPVTVVAIVTGTAVTSDVVQNGSGTTVSSADSYSGASSTTTAGSPSDPPTQVSLSPTSGSISGGNTVTLTSSTAVAPTAIEIGTAAEFEAGTVVTVLPCDPGDTSRCFEIDGSSTLIHMPSRSSPATVLVSAVTLGVAGSASYVYSGTPGAPAAVTATAGLASASLSWTAPAANTSPISSYVITPYLAGVPRDAITVDAAGTTRLLTRLTVGGSYTFTVTAVNAQGASHESAASSAVVPYAALGAPTITAVRSGDSSAVLTWTAPSSTAGRPITGYVVTPYIGATAQTPQTFTGTATTRTVTGLTPGEAYTFRVAAQNDSGTTALYRVNGGGPAVPATDGGLDWAADSGSGSPYHGNIGTAQYSPSAALDSTIPPETPLALFDTEAYGNMDWSFPVPAGQLVKVRLYFVNRYGGTGTVGKRVFDVSLDGARVLNSFDIITGAGADQTATMREFSVTSDGALDIGFTARADNALVSAIEIYQTGQSTTGPASDASTSTTPNDSPTLDFAAPPPASTGVAYSAQLTATGGTAPFTWSIASGSLPDGLTLSASTGLLSGTPTTSGSYAFTVRIVDASDQSATQAVTLTVTEPPALSITTTASSGEVVAGGTVGYTIRATNTGGADYQVATLTDDLGLLLPYGVYAGDAIATTGTVALSGNTLSWSGPLARGEVVVITFSVKVAPETPDSTLLTNRVASTSTGSTCPADSVDPGCTTSTAIAARSISLTGLTPSFTLTGLPGSTVEQDGAVGMTVTTNSTGGYGVTVSSTTDRMRGRTGNSDTIPIDLLSVRGAPSTAFVPMSTTSVRVHTSTGPTSGGGDVISNDFQVDIPDVTSDTYTTELEYIATAQ